MKWKTLIMFTSFLYLCIAKFHRFRCIWVKYRCIGWVCPSYRERDAFPVWVLAWVSRTLFFLCSSGWYIQAVGLLGETSSKSLCGVWGELPGILEQSLPSYNPWQNGKAIPLQQIKVLLRYDVSEQEVSSKLEGQKDAPTESQHPANLTPLTNVMFHLVG